MVSSFAVELGQLLDPALGAVPGTVAWVLVIACATLVGFSKTGIAGSGILIVPVMASLFGARASVGILLPMLVMADVMAIAYYRRQAVWRHLLQLAPWTVAGMLAGYAYLELGPAGDDAMRWLIGSLVLGLLTFQIAWARRDPAEVPTWFAGVFGVFGGFATMTANAAGPFLAIYLLAMRLPKMHFVGTGAWFFFAANAFKLPFLYNLGLITPESLKLDVMMLPAIILGAFIGVRTVHAIDQRWFDRAIQVLAAAAAVKLLVG